MRRVCCLRPALARDDREGEMSGEKIVMFDFDGVIADSWCAQKSAFVETLRSHGLHEFATSATFRDLLDANWFEALRGAGVPEEVVLEIEQGFGDGPTPELFPGMAEVIERLAEAHPVVVITSSATADVERILRERRVRGVAEVIGGDVEPSKTRKIRCVRRRFGESREAWYVGDTTGDVIEAREAGAATVGAGWGWHGEERLLRAGPDRMARRPSDLLDLL
jgi:phosphoglycolate phosphatase